MFFFSRLFCLSLVLRCRKSLIIRVYGREAEPRDSGSLKCANQFPCCGFVQFNQSRVAFFFLTILSFFIIYKNIFGDICNVKTRT